MINVLLYTITGNTMRHLLLIGVSLIADRAQSPLTAPFDMIAILTCPPSPPHTVIREYSGAYATVEGACFTSRCFGGWITLVLHVSPAQMTGLYVIRGWGGSVSSWPTYRTSTATQIPAKILHQYRHSFLAVALHADCSRICNDLKKKKLCKVVNVCCCHSNC